MHGIENAPFGLQVSRRVLGQRPDRPGTRVGLTRLTRLVLPRVRVNRLDMKVILTFELLLVASPVTTLLPAVRPATARGVFIVVLNLRGSLLGQQLV